MPDDDRYEPLPDLAALPGWLWRRTGTKLRIALGLLLLGAIGLTLVLAPRIGESRREREARDARERAAAHARLVAEQRAEQVPRFRETRFRDTGLGARLKLVEHMRAQILADARERKLDGPLMRVECERFPRAATDIRPELDVSKPTARYSCLVVTSEFEGGLLGHRYRSKVDFRGGMYAFCKVAGRPGVERDPEVTTPRACGG